MKNKIEIYEASVGLTLFIIRIKEVWMILFFF